MATDSTLVQGAYNANKGYDVDKSGVSKAINKGISGLSKAAENRKKEEEARKEVGRLKSIEAGDKARENTEAEEGSPEQEHSQYKKKKANESHTERLATAIEMYGQEDSILDSDRNDKIVGPTSQADLYIPPSDGHGGSAQTWGGGTTWNMKMDRLDSKTQEAYNLAEDNPGIDSHFDSMRDILEQQKRGMEPSKLKKTGVKMLNKLSVGVQQFKGLKDRILNLNRERKNGTGFQKNMSANTDAMLADVVSGKIPLESKTIDGEVQLGFRINGEYLNMGDIGRLLDDNQTDVESQASIIGIRDIQVGLAETAGPEDIFNFEKVRSSMGDVVRKGNLKSLVNDEIFGGTSFAEDLYKSGLAGMTYDNLGVSDIYDTDGDGKFTSNDNLSIDDRKAIIDELINNPSNVSILEEEVIDYFTNHVQSNWDMNHLTRSQSNPLPNGSMMGTYKANDQQVTKPSPLISDLPGIPKRSLSEEDKLKKRLEKKGPNGLSSMDYINMINI